ncbi:MAG: YlxR family protein [Christensenellaceae bacterium]|jgi:predicted RNA-binding protein YlxR (DUF448 family)|nr:YlxR family protein [Christensenellaceae bacterium]
MNRQHPPQTPSDSKAQCPATQSHVKGKREASGRSKKESFTRSCCVCKTRKHKNELIRVRKTKDGTFHIEANGENGSGRGIYICKCAACIKECVTKKSLNRGFKGVVPNEAYEALAILNINNIKY